jgi:aspartate ammonia-lyase
LLSSGPDAGLADIQLPRVQAGSSIMPGKVNPVIPEVVNQIAFEVIGNDVTVTMAAEGGQLQLNAFEPIILHSILSSINHLEAGCCVLAERCVTGITADEKRLRDQVERSTMIATALSPHLGYAVVASLVTEAERTGHSVSQLAIERRLLSSHEIQAILTSDPMSARTPTN